MASKRQPASENELQLRPIMRRSPAKPREFKSKKPKTLRQMIRAHNRRLDVDQAPREARTPGAVAGVERPPTMARRVVVKAHVAQLNKPGAAAAAGLHLRYIQRDGVERDGSAGQLYGAAGPVRGVDFGDALPGEQHQFRMIVSPEDGAHVDLTAFTKDLMAAVERDTGRQLRWAAVNHYNTDNPHVHLIVRGLDRAGQPVRFAPDYISHGIRWRAQEFVTRELGLRTELDVRNQLQRESGLERTTSIDRDIDRKAGDARTIDLRDYQRTEGKGLPREVVAARAATLERLGLAQRTSPTTWQLPDGWLKALDRMSARSDIIRTMHRAMAGEGDLGRFHILGGDAAPVAQFVGKVRGKGLHDELKGTYYVVVESHRGEVCYTTVPAAVAERLHAGQLVQVSHSGREEGKAPRTVVRGMRTDLAQTVAYRGPTWLDDPRTDARTAALFGFGAELRAALRDRERVRKELGIEGGPGALGALRALERRELGARLTTETGATFVPGVGTATAFRGSVRTLEPLPSGQRFVQVTDEARNRFMLLPATDETRGLEGRKVTISRSREGEIQMREADLGKGIE